MEGNSLCGGSQTGWAERKNLFDHLSGKGIKIRMIVLFSFSYSTPCVFPDNATDEQKAK